MSEWTDEQRAAADAQRDAALAHECVTCRAAPGAPCTTAAGNPMQTCHSLRIEGLAEVYDLATELRLLGHDEPLGEVDALRAAAQVFARGAQHWRNALPDSAERERYLFAYQEAANLLGRWADAGRVPRLGPEARLRRAVVVTAPEDRRADAEAHVAWLVTDHDAEPKRIGTTKFVGPDCARCGRRSDEHLSYGVTIAERVGGHPLDYVRRPEPPMAPDERDPSGRTWREAP